MTNQQVLAIDGPAGCLSFGAPRLMQQAQLRRREDTRERITRCLPALSILSGALVSTAGLYLVLGWNLPDPTRSAGPASALMHLTAPETVGLLGSREIERQARELQRQPWAGLDPTVDAPSLVMGSGIPFENGAPIESAPAAKDAAAPDALAGAFGKLRDSLGRQTAGGLGADASDGAAGAEGRSGLKAALAFKASKVGATTAGGSNFAPGSALGAGAGVGAAGGAGSSAANSDGAIGSTLGGFGVGKGAAAAGKGRLLASARLAGVGALGGAGRLPRGSDGSLGGFGGRGGGHGALHSYAARGAFGSGAESQAKHAAASAISGVRAAHYEGTALASQPFDTLTTPSSMLSTGGGYGGDESADLLGSGAPDKAGPSNAYIPPSYMKPVSEVGPSGAVDNGYHDKAKSAKKKADLSFLQKIIGLVLLAIGAVLMGIGAMLIAMSKAPMMQHLKAPGEKLLAAGKKLIAAGMAMLGASQQSKESAHQDADAIRDDWGQNDASDSAHGAIDRRGGGN